VRLPHINLFDTHLLISAAHSLRHRIRPAGMP
jgi:hypothetical protein